MRKEVTKCSKKDGLVTFFVYKLTAFFQKKQFQGHQIGKIWLLVTSLGVKKTTKLSLGLNLLRINYKKGH